MRQPFFKPHVGQDYCRSGISGIRILCVGESHYVPAGSTMEAENKRCETRLVVAHQVYGTGGHRYFGNIHALLRDATGIKADKAELWNKIAFSNFIQEVPPVRDVFERARRRKSAS